MYNTMTLNIQIKAVDIGILMINIKLFMTELNRLLYFKDRATNLICLGPRKICTIVLEGIITNTITYKGEGSLL